LFHPPGEEGTDADQDRTNALLRKSCEGRFEIAIGCGIHDNELPAQRARISFWAIATLECSGL